jgi:hypothetical protein
VCEALPVGMLARLSALGAERARWAQGHRDARLAEQEQAVLAAVRAALPDLLGAVVRLSVTTLDPGVARVRRRCPACGGRTRVPSWRPRQVRSICGPLRISRPWYHCRRCRRGSSPVDDALDLAPRAALSDGLGAWVVRLGATTTFREAAALLAELTGLVVAPDTVRAQSTRCGAALAATEQAAVAQVLATQASAAPVDEAPGALVIEADGVMVRYRDGWHEVKVGLVGGALGGPLHAPSYIAAREEAEHFGPRLLSEAARRGALDVIGWDGPLGGRSLAALRPVHVGGDGAP